MTNDAPEREIRVFLRHMANEVPAPIAAPPRLLRRARRNIAARVGIGAAALALLLVAIASGVASVRDLERRTPAQPGPVPATLKTVARIEVSDAPSSMAVGDGSVWVSHPLSISRIDPASNSVVQTVHVLSAAGPSSDRGSSFTPGPCHAQDGACGGSSSSDRLNVLAFGSGALWATSSDGGGRVFRIDPGTDRVTAAIDVPGAYGVAAGEDAVWVLGSAFGSGGSSFGSTRQPVKPWLKSPSMSRRTMSPWAMGRSG